MATDRLKKKIGKGRHASSIKRDGQALKLRARNKQDISRMKTAVKKVRSSKSQEELKKAIPLIAKAGRKGMIHKRKAARLISRLSKFVQVKA